ncbi:MAG: magnesium protoporphyrin IX methyltransferase [Myxococcota bacterium]
MTGMTYERRRADLEHYFDRTAAETWARLTSSEPVSRIRATVRAGRDAMREQLLDWLPADLSGARILDAGCGTGAFAVEAARRGADVVAVDLSPTLVGLARQRHAGSPELLGRGRVDFRVGDMLDPGLGRFDHVVAMDSLIHYEVDDMLRMIDGLCDRSRRSVLVTFAPFTVPLAVMHAVGQVFPRSDRSPAIVPIRQTRLLERIASPGGPRGFAAGRCERVATTFYISQALELVVA